MLYALFSQKSFPKNYSWITFVFSLAKQMSDFRSTVYQSYSKKFHTENITVQTKYSSEYTVSLIDYHLVLNFLIQLTAVSQSLAEGQEYSSRVTYMLQETEYCIYLIKPKPQIRATLK